MLIISYVSCGICPVSYATLKKKSFLQISGVRWWRVCYWVLLDNFLLHNNSDKRDLMLYSSLNVDGLLTCSSVFFLKKMSTNRHVFGLYKHFQKKILRNFRLIKVVTKMPSIQVRMLAICTVPIWSPWPPWPLIYANFMNVKTTSCTEARNICLFETAAVCWDEHNVESLWCCLHCLCVKCIQIRELTFFTHYCCSQIFIIRGSNFCELGLKMGQRKYV